MNLKHWNTFGNLKFFVIVFVEGFSLCTYQVLGLRVLFFVNGRVMFFDIYPIHCWSGKLSNNLFTDLPVFAYPWEADSTFSLKSMVSKTVNLLHFTIKENCLDNLIINNNLTNNKHLSWFNDYFITIVNFIVFILYLRIGLLL